MDLEDLRQLSDADLIALLDGPRLPSSGYENHYALRGTALLASSALLCAPPTYKAYRGHIGFSMSGGYGSPSTGICFVGFTTFGKVDGEQVNPHLHTTDLDAAIKAVNKTLKSKLTPRKGYRPEPDTGAPLLDREQVLVTICQIVNGERPTPQHEDALAIADLYDRAVERSTGPSALQDLIG